MPLRHRRKPGRFAGKHPFRPPKAAKAVTFGSGALEQVGHNRRCRASLAAGSLAMNGIIYLVGLVVIVMAILSFVGLR